MQSGLNGTTGMIPEYTLSISLGKFVPARSASQLLIDADFGLRITG
jgi:hypothetical protein